MLNLSRVIKPWKESDALSAHINLLWLLESDDFSDQERRPRDGPQRARR